MSARTEAFPRWRLLLALGVLSASLAVASAAPDQWDFSIGWAGAMVSAWVLRWPR